MFNRGASDSGDDISDISRENFPLPSTLADWLDGVSDDCYNGRGFVLLRGLNPQRHSPEDNAALFAGISLYVAPQRGFQDLDHSHVLC
jgi:hypothetical protein